jgi:hypothetical protein
MVMGRNPPCTPAPLAPVAVAGRVRDHPLSTSSATTERPRGEAPAAVPAAAVGDAGAGLERLGGSDVCTTIDGVGWRDAVAAPADRPAALEGRAPVGVVGAAATAFWARDWSGEVEGRSGWLCSVVGVSVCAVGGAELSISGDDIG